MVERWVASAWLLTEKHFRRIDGHADLWALAATLGREEGLARAPMVRSCESVCQTPVLRPAVRITYSSCTTARWFPNLRYSIEAPIRPVVPPVS